MYRSHLRTLLGFHPLLLLLLLTGCQTMRDSQPLPTVPYVDLPRFMGDWYVIANIPTFVEKDSYAATETYRLAQDGTIETTFSQRKGGFDAPLKRSTPRGFIRNTQTNAEWAMQFIWPFKAEYLIVYLDEAYSQTIIGRTKRDFVWIMARTPEIPAAQYAALTAKVRDMGYDLSKLRRVPQTPAIADSAASSPQ